MCVLIFSTTTEKFLIRRRIQRDVIKDVYWSSCKVPVFLVRFERNVNFLGRFGKNPEIPTFMKNPSVSTERYNEATGRSSKFCKRA